VSSLDEVIALLKSWIDQDKKVKELKDIQGLIWKEGYAKGEYTAHLYPDVLPSFEKWKNSGIDLYIYSSGSIQAQKLLFSHTEHGDITPLLSGYFDTTTGAKKEFQSYKNIAKQIGIDPKLISFFTDSIDEAHAATDANFNVFHVNRDGLYNDSKFIVIKSFDEARIINE
jgi:enolase-phosphatase E1